MTVTSTRVQYPFFQRSVWTDSRYANTIFNFTSSAYGQGFGTSFNTVDRNVSADWKKRVVKRLDASNYYKRVINECDPAFARARTIYKPSYTEVATNTIVWLGSTPGTFPDASDSALLDIAVARCKRKLNNVIGNTNLLVPTAEVKELRQTVNAMTKYSFGYVQRMVELVAKKGKSVHKVASDIWLGYNFGLAPMLKTVDDVSASLKSYYDRTDRVVRVSGTATRDWRSGSYYSSAAGTRHAVCSEHIETYKRLSYRVIAGFSLPLRSSNNYGLEEHLGFKMPMILPALWEITAYSWIVDYFGTVGAYLEDAVESPKGDSIYVVRCKRFTATSIVRLSHRITTSGARFVSQESIPGWQKYIEFERQPLTALPRAALRLRTRDEIGIHGVNKLLNLAALLVQRIARS